MQLHFTAATAFLYSIQLKRLYWKPDARIVFSCGCLTVLFIKQYLGICIKMVVKIYISGISGNKEVKKRQQRVSMILDSKNIKYDLIDIAEPGNEADKDYMQANSTCIGATIGDAKPKYPLPPQIYNDANYCGDYDKFDIFNENDELDQFLKLSPADMTVTSSAEVNLKIPEALQKQAEDVQESENNEDVKNGGNEIDNAPSEGNAVEEVVAENGGDGKETTEKGAEEPENVENGDNEEDN